MYGREGGAFSGTPYVPGQQDQAGRVVVQRQVSAVAAKVDPTFGLVSTFGPTGTNVGWLIGRMVVQGPAGSRALVYVGDITPGNLADGSQSGALDVADLTTPIYVPPSTAVRIQWTDAAGAIITTGTAIARVELVTAGG